MISAEQTRIAAHIEHAWREASSRDVSHLSPAAQLVRQLLLEELDRYRLDARFPHNPDFAERTPYFVDASGTRCAMAHLIELGGAPALVERIATERNNARVHELADEPALIAWLEAAGLTVDEAAAIQPSYSCGARSECICGGSFSNVSYEVPSKGVLECTEMSNNLARIERIYGDGLGYVVGDTIRVRAQTGEGGRVLVPLSVRNDADGGDAYPTLKLGADGNYSCRSQGVSEAPALSPEHFAQAVTATSCKATLASIDPAWGKSCDQPLEAPRGCAVTGGDASVGILLALVAALIRRRANPRRRR